MKKLFIFSSALIITVLASCNKEQTEVPVDINENDNIIATGVFSFPAIREVPTKSYLGEDNNFVWGNGESIAVVYGTTVKEFKYNESSNLFSCKDFEESATGPFYVVSPFRSDLTIEDGKVVSELPATQTAGNHGVDSNALVSIGQAANIEDLKAGVSLKNAFSLIKVAITDSDVSSISFEGNADGVNISPVLAGPVKVSAEGVATVSGRKTAVTLKASSGNLAAGSYYLAVVPQTLSKGLKVVFKREGEDQAYYRKASSKSYELKANEGIDLGSFTVANISNRCWYIQDNADMLEWRSQTAKTDIISLFLADDINMEGSSIAPVTTGVVFDGQNHCIGNFKSERSGANAGFFTQTWNPVKNIIFGSLDGTSYDNSSIITLKGSGGWWYVAPICRALADVTNVRSYVPVTILSDCVAKVRAAGVIAHTMAELTIDGCINYATVLSDNPDKTTNAECLIGGVISCCQSNSDYTEGEKVIIKNCSNYGDVISKDPFTTCVGGILSNSPAKFQETITNCHNYGNVAINTTKTPSNYKEGYVGGIAGYLNFSGITGSVIENCTNHADLIVSGITVGNIGGITARVISSDVIKCINDGDIKFDGNVAGKALLLGGIAGGMYTAPSSNVKNCVNNGNISSNKNQVNRVGGIIGTVNSGATTVYECINNGTITIARSNANTNWQAAGGIVGFQQASNPAIIEKCENHNTVLVAMENNTTHANQVTAGGIIGYGVNKVQLIGNYNDGEVIINNTGSSNSIAGGVAGWFTETEATGDTNTGSVSATSGSGTAYAGALVGNNAGTFTNAKVKGSVNGTVLTASNFNDYLYGTNTGSVSGTTFITE